MLNKDLLRYNTRAGEIKPKFIKTDDPALLRFADSLLQQYAVDREPTRGDLDEVVTPLINGQKDLKLAKGINKLILDKSKFKINSDLDHVQLRRDVFSLSNELIKSPSGMSFQAYHNRMAEMMASSEEYNSLGQPGESAAVDCGADIYADLPSNESLVDVKQMFPRELLERYNTSLVQSFLLYAKELTVTFEEPDPARMRSIFRYLRFFRLLAQTKKVNCARSGVPRKVVLDISGPMSVFENTQKYALQLACFFPAICLMSKWKIETDVKLGKKELKFKLTSRSGLVSHYRDSSYVPEEVSMFAQLFREKVADWFILDEPSFIDLGNQELVFPDQSYQNNDGKIIHLELFHRWHSHQLLRRLEYLEQNPSTPLIIGVDRALYKKETKALLDNSEWFQNNGFLFRDFPGVDRVKKCLNLAVK